ncbi:TetR/AcrR family transcriptional regulator [uncultured Modestobacter sp.]|uniref:TetR/AcrR family transcriptional regulator n=1 Tax=uncultured Modestobacter sp. TaxID=380048 RepID=UPI00262A8E20|nr:TetR family transcriptional regulator [uncultured Modestobacter sp.]
MSEATGGRRERRKAQTRAEVRETAQRLFAERGFDAVTIADVAAAADVAVQTVFNHFETKEALFFDGRTPWVEGVAAAVAARPAGTGPLSALCSYLETDLSALLEQEARPENRSYLEALASSASLQARERTLVEQAGELVAGALVGAIAPGDPAPSPAVQVVSRLAADLFLITGRVLVLDHRRRVLDGAPAQHRRPVTPADALTVLEDGVRELARRLDVPVD